MTTAPLPSPTLAPTWQTLQTELTRIHHGLQALNTNQPPDLPPRTALPESHPLSQLQNRLHLSPFELDILLLCLATELDPHLAQLCAEITGSAPAPNFALAFALFPEADYAVCSPQNPLHTWHLLEIAPGINLTQSPLRLDQRILCYLLGQPATDAHLGGLIRFSHLPDRLPLPPSQANLAAQMQAAWQQSPQALLQLCSPDPSLKTQITDDLAQLLGCTLGTFALADLPTTAHNRQQLLRRWERESLLSDRILLIDSEDLPQTDPARLRSILGWLESFQTPVVLSTLDPLTLPQRTTLSFRVPMTSFPEKLSLWHTYLGDQAEQLNGEVAQLSAQFDLTPSAIRAACHQAQTQTDQPLVEYLWSFCRAQARPKLDDLAQRINSTSTWDNLVLPKKQHQILHEIADQLQYQAQVYHQWGFGGVGQRGMGLTTLFHGPSGTGKTLAAEVLANVFKLDLYRIDLSAVVSKYIGETEKNLRRIFDAATVGGVILLFDEADALFGKRTEVKDSHDRHANVEVSYLLQRMEAYPGLAILTTNLKDALDQAFMRRIRFMVGFPFPDQDSRSEIWRCSFPPQTPTEGLNYDCLGQLEMCGGNIRSIALNAAFFAAADQSPITMHHIHQAAQRECLKLQRSLTQRELADWFD